MPAFTATYTDDQRDAAAAAYVDRRIPAPRVAELAAAGELTLNGRPIEPFEIIPQYVRTLGTRLRRRRAGDIEREIAKLPARDSIEALRRRLVSTADQELAALERQKPGKRDLERFRQVIRCVREAAALPGAKDPRPSAPGRREGGGPDREGAETRGGLAGDILRAHNMNLRGARKDGEPAG
jgi:hypothetical protein